MRDGITIRPSEARDRDEILAFVERMGFNPRDAVTWDALGMSAMTAWRGDNLIGAIPMEPRVLQLQPGLLVPTVHETVVAVEPAERSKGIGSRMQDVIARMPPGGARLVSVFREEPESPAYRWYERNAFRAVMRIDSWFHEVASNNGAELQAYDLDAGAHLWPAISRLWHKCVTSSAGGFVDRTARPLQDWLSVHPYRRQYAFHVLCLRDDERLIAYALAGTGRMHSDSVRMDVLDTAAVSAGAMKDLIRGLLRFCAERRHSPVRWPITRGHGDAEIARSLGFEPRWSFDMLVRPLDEEIAGVLSDLTTRRWRYAGVDYI